MTEPEPAPPRRWPTSPCASCKAPIIWAETARSGTPQPIDFEPSTTGNIALEHRPGRPPLSRVVAPKLAFGRNDLRLPHHATCPDAQRHRKGPTTAARRRRAGAS